MMTQFKFTSEKLDDQPLFSRHIAGEPSLTGGYIDLSARSHNSVNIGVNYAGACHADPCDINSRILRLLRFRNGQSAPKAVIPRLIDIYRTSYWEHTPTMALDLDKSLRNRDYGKTQRRDYLWRLFFEIIHTRKACISSISKRKIISAVSSAVHPILFDSYWFFSSGHIIPLSETIECILESTGKYISLLLVNKNMVLFPEVLHMLEFHSPDIAVVYSNECSFNLSTIKARYRSLQFLDREPLALRKHGDSVTTHDPSSINPSLSMHPKLRKVRPKKDLDIDSLWRQRYSTACSKDIINNTLREKGRRLKHEDFIVYHARNPSFRWPSVRDSPSIMERSVLCDLLDKMGVSVINIGIISEEVAAWDHPNVVHLGELGPIHSSVQLHAFNAAAAVIGSASGMTLISRLVDTPCLWIDLPYPFIAWPPSSGHKILLKRLRRSGTFESIARYFQLSPDYFASSDQPGDHPLINEGYELLPNTDIQIFKAFCELIAHTCCQRLGKLAGNKDIDELLFSDMDCMIDLDLIESAIIANQDFSANGFRYLESISSLARP